MGGAASATNRPGGNMNDIARHPDPAFPELEDALESDGTQALAIAPKVPHFRALVGRDPYSCAFSARARCGLRRRNGRMTTSRDGAHETRSRASSCNIRP